VHTWGRARSRVTKYNHALRADSTKCSLPRQVSFEPWRARPDGHQAILFRYAHNLAGAAGHTSLVA
jgi:hypothetical protein